MSIIERLSALRAEMEKLKIDAIIIPSDDPHFSEYTADYWKVRRWISGFTGSAGTVVVTKDNAGLWTDSRYFGQAEKELKNTGIELFRMKQPEVLEIHEWLKYTLNDNEDAMIGIDPKLFSLAEFSTLVVKLAPLKIKCVDDPFVDIWKDRPSLPYSSAFLLPETTTGMGIKEKLTLLKERANLDEYTVFMVSALDEIAWLLNMRASDVECNPVAIAYVIVDYPNIHLFIGKGQLSDESISELQKDGVVIHPYYAFDSFIEGLTDNHLIKVNKNKLNLHTYELIRKCGLEVMYDPDPNGSICSLKATKNEVELEGFRKAMIIDGIALVRYFNWLEKTLDEETITEIEAANKLHEFRAMSPSYVGDSFGTISAYGANGAMPHYSAREDSNSKIKRDSFYLVDSGGQYSYGTTDITRTTYLGEEPSEEEMQDYTAVLKGMIALSCAVFPEGTRGSQLDVLARQFLWKNSKNFLHGTGHGVGHFLNVHEGPQNIRMEHNPVSIQVGMVTSNEPAIYIEGEYGIRTENLIACIKHSSTKKMGDFLAFETLTLCPIDTKAIDLKLMSPDEIKWLNDYHKTVYDRLSPLLQDDDLRYLEDKTKAITF